MNAWIPPPVRARLRASLVLAILALFPDAARAQGPGKIVVFDDEWVLSDFGLSQNPEGAQFALNIANWFTGGQPGNFLAYSTNIGLGGVGLAQAMTAAGHTWKQGAGGPQDLASIQAYDGLWLGGVPFDNNVLIQYVQGGGNVYVMAGTAWAPSAAAEAGYWNTFLSAFGLSFDTVYNGIGNFPVPMASAHPVLSGVTGLYHSNGQSILDLDPNDDSGRVLQSFLGQGIVAVYEELSATIYCTAKLNSQGCTPAITFQGVPSISSGLPFFVGAQQVINQKPGFLFYGLSGRLAVPFLGGTLCALPPLRRTTVQSTGGNPPPDDCSGVLMRDFNAWMPVDPLLGPGVTVNAQYFYRDTASSFFSGLSDAVEFTIQP